MNRTLIAWLIAVVLAIGGLVPFFTASARVITPPVTRLYAPLVFIVPPWSAVLFAASFVLAFALAGGVLRFAGTTRPLLIVVTGAWVLHATGFWRIGLPVDRLVEAESAGDMFRLTSRNAHEDWVIGGSQLGWAFLVVVVVLSVVVEMILSRKKVQGRADASSPGFSRDP